MFQEKLLELLDAFEIESAASYRRLPPGRRPYFLGRLYKTFRSDTRTTLARLKTEGGVKFHFDTAPSLGVDRPNVPDETFLKKAAFYANVTVVTFPFREVTGDELRTLKERAKGTGNRRAGRGERRRESRMYFGDIAPGTRTPVGGFLEIRGKVYTVNSRAVDDLVSLIATLRPAIASGVTNVLPTFPDTASAFRDRKCGLTPANFYLAELRRQFSEMPQVPPLARGVGGLGHLLLPYFARVPMERILEIRAKETGLYVEFQRRLEQLLRGASQTDSETKILELLRDVDLGVRELHNRFQDLEREYRRRDLQLLVKFMLAGLTLLTPLDLEVKASVASILGSVSAFDYVDAKSDRSSRFAEARRDRFYLAWEVFRTTG